MKYIIGIDLGGMSAKGGLFSENGELLTEEKVATCREDGFEGTLEKLANLSRVLVEKMGVDYADVLAIGVGSPGVVDGKEGIVLRWSNYDWNNVPFAKTLSQLTGKKVYVANDANVAALGDIVPDLGDKSAFKPLVEALAEFVRTGEISNETATSLRRHRHLCEELRAAEHPADEVYLKEISSERPTQQALAREIYLRCEPLFIKYDGFLAKI